jgi:DNA-binding ferritin-like protein (Dps family)
MTKQDFKKYENRAVQLCEDYQTTTPESDTVTMIWFTPKQLKMYTEYCIRAAVRTNSVDNQ